MITQLTNKFQNLSIVKKMIVGYIIIIFIPIISFGLFLYNENYNRIMNEYAQGRQKIIDQVRNNLKVSAIQIESYYQLFQYNSNVIAYLNGTYRSDYDQTYNFLTYIRPLFSYISFSNMLIDNVKIYITNHNVIIPRPEMTNIDDFPFDESVMQLPLGVGKWMSLDDGNHMEINLHYFHKIGYRSFEQELGILDISVTTKMIAPLMKSLNIGDGSNLYILNEENQEIYRQETLPLPTERKRVILQDFIQKNPHAPFQTLNGKKVLIESFYSDELKLRFVVMEPLDELFHGINKNKYYLVLIVSLLLLALSGIYYLIALSITRRILKLSKHMRQVDENYFPIYRGEIMNDEVGQLTYSYNSMITRIDDLVNTVHRSELMRKEAAYQMMQAQIKPHFLYNTLESIRMIAEANDDPEAADMSYTLGKLFRYSLSGTINETVLQEEIEYVKDYVSIQKIRMTDRLNVSFDIAASMDHFVCPRFILQPLVENSIVHGIANVRKQSILAIRVYEDSSHMYISIADTGSGIKEDRLRIIQGILNNATNAQHLQTSGGSLGLYNVNERIKMFYGEDSGIQIESMYGEGTICTLKLFKGA
jgi:two-component system sensor histidine kinase YesM